MPRAVRFERYGDVDVLEVVEVPRPVPQEGQVVVRVRAAGINPGEATIRRGLLHERWPATFPSGQGSDLAGVVDELTGIAGITIGDEVIAFTHDRASHAEAVAVDAGQPDPPPRRSLVGGRRCALVASADRLRRGAGGVPGGGRHGGHLRRRRRRGDHRRAAGAPRRSNGPRPRQPAPPHVAGGPRHRAGVLRRRRRGTHPRCHRWCRPGRLHRHLRRRLRRHGRRPRRCP